MNATGESDQENYDGLIENQQESKLRPVFDQLLPVMFMSEFGYVPDDLDIRFLPVRSPSESDLADQVSKKTTAIKDAFDSGLINQKIGMKELKAMSKATGMFTNITDEDIEMASSDFVDENMMEGLGNAIPGLAAEQNIGTEVPSEPPKDNQADSRLGKWFKRRR
jgi:hypothetical protein